MDWPGSLGDGSWPLLPSNAHQRTGCPAEHPWYDVQMCEPLLLAGSGGIIAVQPLFFTQF